MTVNRINVWLCAVLLALGCVPLAPAQVTGTGTTNFIPIWTTSTAQGNSTLFQTGG